MDIERFSKCAKQHPVFKTVASTATDTHRNQQQQQTNLETDKEREREVHSISSINDIKLQELRAFALEYVKQIVAKASELAQERQEAKNAYKMAQLCGGDAKAIQVKTNDDLANTTTKQKLKSKSQQLKDAAAQIDNKFQRNWMQGSVEFSWPLFCQTAKKRNNNKQQQSDKTTNIKHTNNKPNNNNYDSDQQNDFWHESTTNETISSHYARTKQGTGIGRRRKRKNQDDNDSNTARDNGRRGSWSNLSWSQLLACLLPACLPESFIKSFKKQ